MERCCEQCKERGDSCEGGHSGKDPNGNSILMLIIS